MSTAQVEVNGRVREAWAAHLRRFPWDTWGTLTFRQHLNAIEAFGQLQALIDSFTGAAGHPLPWFATLETGAHGSPHVHVLIRGLRAFAVRDITARWHRRNGYALIRRFEESKGGIRYVLKGAGDALFTWAVSEGFSKAQRRLDRRQFDRDRLAP